MPVTPTYPGVYIEEVPSGVRTITGVATSITAFLGRAKRGETNEPTEINNFGDFERSFGGLWKDGPMSYAVRDFYLNGGSRALIVRLFEPEFENEAARLLVLAAANAVSDAAAGEADDADPGVVATAARDAADDIADDGASEAEIEAADDVATAAETAAAAGGATAISVKAAAANAASSAAPLTEMKLTVGTIPLVAANLGAWSNGLRADVDDEASAEVAERFGLNESDLFNLTVRDVYEGTTETFLNVTLAESPRRIDKVLEQSSNLVRWYGDFPGDAVVPAAAASDPISTAEKGLEDAEKALAQKKLEGGDTAVEEAAVTTARAALATAKQNAGSATDGNSLAPTTFVGSEDDKTGMYALEKADLFNLLCIPADSLGGDTAPAVYQAAMAYCVKRRAMLIVDPLASWSANKDKAAAEAKKGLPDLGLSGTDARNAALYFPRVRYPDPLRDNQLNTFVPCGMVAGVMARTDVQRGVWKAPAGIDAALNGTQALEVNLTDDENGILNPLGINCLRNFPIIGRVVWGARTVRGADLLADEYKYVPIRRLALFIEESLYRGTQWVVFEPNDEPLWSQIRLNVGAFMHNLFRQGAFQGVTPREAYLVKVDSETTTQNDINLGIVNVVVGFAPLKPAEFVILKIQQLAGQVEA